MTSWGEAKWLPKSKTTRADTMEKRHKRVPATSVVVFSPRSQNSLFAQHAEEYMENDCGMMLKNFLWLVWLMRRRREKNLIRFFALSKFWFIVCDYMAKFEINWNYNSYKFHYILTRLSRKLSSSVDRHLRGWRLKRFNDAEHLLM